MLLWTAFFVIPLAFTAPMQSEESLVTSSLPITASVIGSLAFIAVAGIIILVFKNRGEKKDDILYQNSSNVPQNVGVEPRYIVAPVPKKPTPTFLEQKFDKPFAVPKITIDPPIDPFKESRSQ